MLNDKDTHIAKAKAIHNNKYDYSQVEFEKLEDSVSIICPTHGEFKQLFRTHLYGAGCNKCAIELRARKTSLTLEEFVEKARKVHGDRYGYDKVNYINSQTKVLITCPDHGDFWQIPGTHLSGAGCFACNGGVRLNTQEFIEKARQVHGDRYGYDKVDYSNSQTKVLITCPDHGDFWQKPNSHLMGKRCFACHGKAQLNTEEFIENARKVHGDRYDYSKTVYTIAKNSVDIICKKHGLFKQSPGNHTTGQGCPYCITRVIVDTEEFIERARKAHGDLYDYSKVKYVDGKGKIIIGCKVHGDFEQAASEHIRGRGCYECNGIIRLTTEEFIERAKKVHGDRYEYSQVDYVNAHDKVKIICKKHEPFYQSPANHLKGTGCPVCCSSKGELAINKILTKHNVEFIQEYCIPNQSYRFKYDFYIPKLNLIIEYHGMQHYVPIEFFGGEEELDKIILRDKVKKFIAKELKYNYIEISYKSFKDALEEEFENRLLKVLSKFSVLY